MMQPEIKPILDELKRAFEAIYGDRLVKLVLFGSQARGDAEPGSDIDVLVVLRGPVNCCEEIKRTSEANADMCLEHAVVIQRVFVSDEQFDAGERSLFRNIRKEGVLV
jgi:predicted nucleotidyltransferase